MFSEGGPRVRPRMFPLEKVPGNEKEPTPRVISQGPGDADRRGTTGRGVGSVTRVALGDSTSARRPASDDVRHAVLSIVDQLDPCFTHEESAPEGCAQVDTPPPTTSTGAPGLLKSTAADGRQRWDGHPRLSLRPRDMSRSEWRSYFSLVGLQP